MNGIFNVKINNTNYDINKQILDKLEPKNILLNCDETEFITRFNEENNTLVYLEDIPYWNLIYDYIMGYNPSNISWFFTNMKQQSKDIDGFKNCIAKLQFFNLLDKIKTYFPIIKINSFLLEVNRFEIITIEPQTNLINTEFLINENVYYHFKDENIFKEYLRDYILGEEHFDNLILRLKTLKENPEPLAKYNFNKIMSDINYYGFMKIFKYLSI